MRSPSSIASSRLGVRVSVTTGPNTSSHCTLSVGAGFAITVGRMRPSPVVSPPVSTSPFDSRTHSRMRSRSWSLITGPDVGRLVGGIADRQRLDLGTNSATNSSHASSSDEDALDRDAALAREREGVRGELRRGALRRVGADDRRRRVAELELHALAVRAFGDAPADAAGAGERDQLHALVGDEHVADLRRRAGDDVQPAGRQAGLFLERREEERRQRRRRRGLEHDRAAGGERGRDLVRDEVEREVERRDRADDPDRQPQRERELPCAGGRSVHRNHLAGELACLDRGEGERRDRALRLDPRRFHRLARLGGDRCARPRRAFLEQPRRPVEDPRALVRGQRRPQRPAAASSARRVSAAPPGAIRPTSSPEYGERTSVQLAGLDLLSVDQERVVDGGRRHPVELKWRTLSVAGCGWYGLARRWRGGWRL